MLYRAMRGVSYPWLGAVILAFTILTSFAGAQPYSSYQADEDIRNYPYLPDEPNGWAHLHAKVSATAKGAYVDSPPPPVLISCWWDGFSFSDEDSDAEPSPLYGTTFTSDRFGTEDRDGGFIRVRLTYDGTPIYGPAYASLGDAYSYCPETLPP